MTHLTHDTAEDVPWCLVVNGVVHCASWFNDYLTAYVDEEGEEDDATDEVLCFHQSIAPFDRLGTEVKLWRDRTSLGLPICDYCLNDIQKWGW